MKFGNQLSAKTVKAFVFIVLALAVLEVIGYGPIGLAGKYQMWNARRKAG